VFLDAMTASGVVRAVEYFMGMKHKMAYAVCDGIAWRMTLWKLAMRPLAFAFGWIAPVFLFWWITTWSFPVGAGLAAVYYLLNVAMLVRWLWWHVRLLITRTPSPTKRVKAVIDEATILYAQLEGPVLHIGSVRAAFDRAVANNVKIDQRTFYILDNLAKRNPPVWETHLHNIYIARPRVTKTSLSDGLTPG
jgi:hypothetical protein